MTTMTKTERIHSMDALRSILMILGIVLHASEAYNLGENDIWPRDPDTTHIFQNYLNSVIHLFRMPLFFLVAGFFGSFLYYERGPIAMLRNRVMRIGLPFAVFLLILHPVILGALSFTSSAFNASLTEISTDFTFLPRISYHLWFLYYLMILTAIAFTLAYVVRRARLGIYVRRVFDWLMTHRPIAILSFSIVIFLLLVWMWDTWVPTPLSFIPDIQVIIFYAFFYFIGWTLYHAKHLLEHFKRFDWVLFILGMSIYTLKYFLSDFIGDVAYGALNALLIWFFVFGIIGLFNRYFNQQSFQMRYISDASYWVYLTHLPLTLFIPGLLAGLPLPFYIKFLIVVMATTFITFITYHFMVRATPIGKFLNGRTYSLQAQKKANRREFIPDKSG